MIDDMMKKESWDFVAHYISSLHIHCDWDITYMYCTLITPTAPTSWGFWSRVFRIRSDTSTCLSLLHFFLATEMLTCASVYLTTVTLFGINWPIIEHLYNKSTQLEFWLLCCWRELSCPACYENHYSVRDGSVINITRDGDWVPVVRSGSTTQFSQYEDRSMPWETP